MSVSTEELVLPVNELYLPIRPDYADFNVDVNQGFNWEGIYGVHRIPIGSDDVTFTFRSQERQGVDKDLLRKLDVEALLAAEGAEGFRVYQPFEAFSYCIWGSQELARAGISSKAHRNAAQYADQAYERWELNCWKAGKSALTGNFELIKIR